MCILYIEQRFGMSICSSFIFVSQSNGQMIFFRETAFQFVQQQCEGNNWRQIDK